MVGRRGLGCTTLNTGLGCDGRLWEDYGKRLPMYTRHCGGMVAPDFFFWHVLVVRPSQVAASSDAVRRLIGFRCARSARSRRRPVSALWHLGWPRVAAGRLLLSGSAVTLKGRRSPLEGCDWPQGPASRRRRFSPLHEKVRRASGQSSFPALPLPLVDFRNAPVTHSSSQRPQR